MASYPSNPVNFTTKTASQTITAGFFNDPQAEITALEQALLTTGLAHNLNPSADNVRSLGSSGSRWVIHGSQISTNTLTPDKLQSTAGTASAVTFYRGDGQWATPAAADAACLVSLDTNVSVPKNAETGLNWLVEDDDDLGMHSTSVNSSRITFVNSTGTYAVGASICWSTVATATGRNHYLRLVLNDTATIATVSMPHQLEFMAANPTYQSISGVVRVQSTADYVTVRVYQESDTTWSILSTLVKGGKSFWAAKVSQ